MLVTRSPVNSSLFKYCKMLCLRDIKLDASSSFLNINLVRLIDCMATSVTLCNMLCRVLVVTWTCV